jgi:hypothetical protein
MAEALKKPREGADVAHGVSGRDGGAPEIELRAKTAAQVKRF